MYPPETKKTDGYFEVAREPATIPFEVFWERYALPERPVVIEGIGADWPAGKTWTESYLQKRLSAEPSAKEAFLWYWMQKNALIGEYELPEIVDKAIDCDDVFARQLVMRIWVHQQNNISSWHYDANMVSVFNVQVTGRKKWDLISPETPLTCYPYTTFAILDGQGDAVFHNKIYTRFTLNQGDMLFIPPLWFHQVEACEPENINLNWVFTKRETQTVSKTFKRDFERYYIAQYFANHKWSFVRTLSQKLNVILPSYARVKWQYDELIRSTYRPTLFNILARFFKEPLALAKTLWNVDKSYVYSKKLRSVKPLERA